MRRRVVDLVDTEAVRGKVYECYLCQVQSEPIPKGKPFGWQMGHAAFDSQRGVWWGRSVRCPQHRAEPRRGASPDATLTTLGEMLLARLMRSA
jgi:hypothetical protein